MKEFQKSHWIVLTMLMEKIIFKMPVSIKPCLQIHARQHGCLAPASYCHAYPSFGMRGVYFHLLFYFNHWFINRSTKTVPWKGFNSRYRKIFLLMKLFDFFFPSKALSGISTNICFTRHFSCSEQFQILVDITFKLAAIIPRKVLEKNKNK